ncbi:acyl carrier protein [Corynebacterium sp. L4756]|uniref:acyl carrier protein n=1 Tax=unclassified Corynebacterium TaxID=2624378 RepID=UPI00374D223A
MSNDLSAQLRAHLSAPTQQSSSAPDYLALIAEITGEESEDLSPDRRLDEVGLTSLNLIEFVVKAEDRLGIRIEEEEALSIETVGDVAKFVEEKQ